MGSIDQSSKCKLDVYAKEHTKEKPCVSNWYFLQNLQGNKSQKNEQNLIKDVRMSVHGDSYQRQKSLA